MKNTYVTAIIVGLLSAASVQARCITNDRWTGPDKVQHLAIGAGISWVGTLHTKDPMKGFYWGAAAGIAKELLDADGSGTCSLQDAAVTVVGAAIGAYTGGLVVTYLKGRVTVAYATSF